MAFPTWQVGWAFEGGLAQYHNAHPSLRQMDAGR
jgi:hypothetical protein